TGGAWQHYDARIPMRRKPAVLKKIPVVREDDSIIAMCEREYVLIRTSDEPHVGDVSDVPASVVKQLGHGCAETLIDEEARLLLETPSVLGNHLIGWHHYRLPRHSRSLSLNPDR